MSLTSVQTSNIQQQKQNRLCEITKGVYGLKRKNGSTFGFAACERKQGAVSIGITIIGTLILQWKPIYPKSLYIESRPGSEQGSLSTTVPVFIKWHDDVIKWKHFPRNWPFVRGIHRSPVNSPHKGQWRGALMFSLICVWITGWVNNHQAGDLRRYRAHYDVTVMGNMSYRQISWSLEAAKLDVILIVSLWNLTGISAALERLKKSKPEFRGFETSWDLEVRRLTAHWPRLSCTGWPWKHRMLQRLRTKNRQPISREPWHVFCEFFVEKYCDIHKECIVQDCSVIRIDTDG